MAVTESKIAMAVTKSKIAMAVTESKIAMAVTEAKIAMTEAHREQASQGKDGPGQDGARMAGPGWE